MNVTAEGSDWPGFIVFIIHCAHWIVLIVIPSLTPLLIKGPVTVLPSHTRSSCRCQYFTVSGRSLFCCVYDPSIVLHQFLRQPFFMVVGNQ